MANWAKLQEQLTGLPVVKRDKHSIHFAKGDGQIVANFSGKPCHYEENGEWKSIDTKLLLLPDGFYGCPHSDVKIHKDGRVKAGGYQQKSTLVNAKEGVVDGDRIVREFEFGTQYLYMTEDGFRQETVITRPPTTQEAKYLIASESGELPSKYKRSDITAVDADGAVHEFVNLGQFKKWLDAAAYPVTIDPDFSVQPDPTAGKDTWLYQYTPNNNFGVSTFLPLFGVSGEYTRTLIQFDLSSIPTGATVSAGTLSIYEFSNVTDAGYKAKIYRGLVEWYEGNANNATPGAGVNGSTWNYRNNNGTVAWSGGAGGGAGSDYEATATDEITLSKLTWNNFTITADAAYWVANPASNFGSWIIRSNAFRYYQFYSSDYTTDTTLRPKLTVTYTAGSTGVPKHFLHYARLRSN